uniref:Protein cereblon n=1 Tax=Timema poppense TaxID=170557 RepID=A0A7R9CZ82_TIMPO|nr:unnamed protein product [Timema poppensis]
MGLYIGLLPGSHHTQFTTTQRRTSAPSRNEEYDDHEVLAVGSTAAMNRTTDFDQLNAETPPYPVYASTSDDDSDNVESQGRAVYSVEHERQFEHTFDPALPVKHSYLGNDLEELQGRTMLDDDSIQTLALLPQPGVVLVPGQTLPLTVFYPPTVSMLRQSIATDRTFGVVCVRENLPEANSNEVTDETRTSQDLLILILTKTSSNKSNAQQGLRSRLKGGRGLKYSKLTDKLMGALHPEDESLVSTDSAVFLTVLSLRLHGLLPSMEGCVDYPSSELPTLATTTDLDGSVGPRNVSARVRILPEVVLPHSLNEIRLASLDRHQSCPGQKRSCFMKRNAMLTQWPSWVHAQFEASRLVKLVTNQLEHLKPGHAGLSIPTDPIDLSYWVAQNLPLSDEQRLTVLKLDSAIQRLRWELNALQKCRVLCCRDCQAKIANQKDVFSMSLEGPQGTYVNPGGYVHETITLHKAKGVRVLNQAPSTEYTWFPGYGWTIAECRTCRKHMGWKFTAMEKHLKPDKFLGLCRRSIFPLFKADHNGRDLIM